MTACSATLGSRWKIIEPLLAMESEGASVDQVTRLLATDGTAMLRDLLQSYVDRCAAQERRH